MQPAVRPTAALHTCAAWVRIWRALSLRYRNAFRDRGGCVSIVVYLPKGAGGGLVGMRSPNSVRFFFGRIHFDRRDHRKKEEKENKVQQTKKKGKRENYRRDHSFL